MVMQIRHHIRHNPGLVRRAQSGDIDSLSMLADKVWQRVYVYVHRVTLCEDLAADLTQDTLMSILGSLSDLRSSKRFWPWVFCIARNKIRQHYRQEGRRKVSTITDQAVFVSPTDNHRNDALTGLVRVEMAEQTRAAMAGMSVRYRTALTLRYFQDLSYIDIALALDCSKPAARLVVHRAKNALARQLKRDLTKP